MMKYMILLALLHLGYSVGLDTNLNKEIISSLEKLNKLCRGNKVSFTSPDTVVVPRQEMYRIASSCVGVYSKDLSNLLNNVTVHEEGQADLQSLKAQLQVLKPYQENDKCETKQPSNIKMTFRLYTTFFKRLNNRR